MKMSIRSVISLLFVFLLLLPLGMVLAAEDSTGEVDTSWRVYLDGGRIQEGSPTLANVDSDVELEIIIGTSGRDRGPVVAVIEHDGDIKWQRSVSDPVASSPTVVDLDYPPDGNPEIVVTTGGDVHQQRGSVIAFDRYGNQLWKYDTRDAQGTGTPSGNFASPVVGDVDGDGDMEIVVASWDRNIYLLDHRGRYLWHYHVADTVWSTPVLADLDGDGDLEIIVGTDIKGGGVLPDGYVPTDGGFVLILDKNGQKLARRQMNETIFSSPAVGDVDRDGDLEIFVGTGMYWYKAGRYSQPHVYGFSVDMTGAQWQLVDLPGWPRPVAYAGMSSPALADLDGDGDLEVTIGTGYTGASSAGACSSSPSDTDCKGALYAWHHTGADVSGFPMWPTDYLGKNAFIQSSPVVGDVDGDGAQEILFSMLWDVIVVDQYGHQEANLKTSYSLFASPAIGDVDGDGRTNIVIGGSDINASDRGRVYNFEYGSSSYSEDAMEWPMFHGDSQNTGLVLSVPKLVMALDSLFLMYDASSADRYIRVDAEIRNVGEGDFDWQAWSLSPELLVDPGSGALANYAELTLEIDTSALSDGFTQLGVVVRGEVDGVEVLGSPVTLPIAVYKGEIHRTFIPLVSR